jgi:DNA-binding GntR family transcriptional regulator
MADESGISRSVLAEQVKDRLLQDILSGVYAPDSRIVETRVARELGTSQAPVREALRGLEAIGIVEITPFRGARVRRPTKKELLEAYEVRAVLESLGARLAVPRMTDVALDALVRLGDEMQAAARAGDRHAVAVADAAFHAGILAIAGNATLVEVWRSLEPFSRTYITLIAPGADAEWTAGLHIPILVALRGRDPEQVVLALRHHFELARGRMDASFDDRGDGLPATAWAVRPG